MNKTVFISSTFVDLKDERKEIWELLKKYDVLIRGMEQFGARKEDSLTTCLTELEQSDIYVGIIGFRLGSIDKKTGKSYTQLEYEKAHELGKEILIYLIDEESSKISPKFIEFDKIPKLNAFKEILKERHTIDTFKDSLDLKTKLSRQFEKYLTKKVVEVKNKDEYIESKSVLDKFFLIPKAISGTEIKLKVKFSEYLFPASKTLCELFSLEFGKTIGNNLDIISPKIDAENFRCIFINYKLIDKFLKLDKSKEYEIYGIVWFHETKVKSIDTTFKDKSYTVWTGELPDDYYENMGPEEPYYTEKKEGEGQIILTLKEISK